MHNPLTFGSLFAGIGGLDLGFERAGMVCKWQVEIDPYARRVLSKHWPDTRKHDDVKTWPQADTESVDCIVGGFPCQDISYAGKGAGLAGERSCLFYEYMRIVRNLEPRIVVLENVAALRTRGFDQVLGSLASLGYDAEWHCVSAASVGAPHKRDRMFILAYSQSERWRTGRARRVINVGQRQKDPAGVADALRPRLEGQRAIARGASPQLPNARDESWWSVEPPVDRVANGVSSRVDRIRCLGNAVVPQVAEFIGRHIDGKSIVLA